MMTAIVFALIAYLGWGVGAFFEVIAARRMSSYSLTFWGLALSVIISSFYLPFAVFLAQEFTLELFLLNILLAGFFIGGIVIYYEALKSENRPLAGTIAQSFPVFIVIFSILFLGERLGFIQSLAVFVTFVGLALCIFDIRDISSLKKILNRGTYLALLVSIFWGFVFTFMKLLVAKVGWFWPNYIIYLLFPLVFLFMRTKKIKLERLTANSVFWPLFISIVFLRIAEYSYNFAISKGQVSLVAPIAGANPTLFVLLAFMFLKDPIKKRQVLGIIVTLAGMVFLSFVG
jgi:uncharacterized membrane protein